MKNQFKTRLKKGDQVIVLTGKDKGKRGQILQVLPKKGAVLVEKVNMIKRHTKADKAGGGGIVEKEAPIHASNVMYYDTIAGKGSGIRMKTLEDGSRTRISRKSGEAV
ncbi:MAG: 50S ribosomal protein L24 [Magnetococcales bacterium]|nr:50S ribosomal protein L24 [Magnetococcales bacterium]MBF0149944.1 50S ribosomal protein L24 [Magnetococcales bacterium]MBF0172887.1 50S ribosomal protein L24 [Magnetococcales bacterium]MBF0346718.1 50S ribosomal protein L24 [Magnetococcales bacterium]MBF0630400.1 50S ribosomal protein L24 [Magnetococcales bacterium]